MIRLDLNQSNENLINSHFQELCCDNFKQSRFKGGQSVADLALSSLDITGYAKKRNDKSMSQKLAAEILAAYKEEGAAFKKKQDTHKMAEANKAFSHFRF